MSGPCLLSRYAVSMSSPSCDSTDGSLRIYEQYAEFHCGDPPTVVVNTLPKALLPKSMQISLHPEGWKLLLVMQLRDFVLTVQATITFKWNSWAKRCLLVELCLYLTWLIAFQVFVLLFQASCAAHLILLDSALTAGILASAAQSSKSVCRHLIGDQMLPQRCTDCKSL